MDLDEQSNEMLQCGLCSTAIDEDSEDLEDSIECTKCRKTMCDKGCYYGHKDFCMEWS